MPGSHQTWTTALSDYTDLFFNTDLWYQRVSSAASEQKMFSCVFLNGIWHSETIKPSEDKRCFCVLRRAALRHHNNTSQKRSKDEYDFSGWLFPLFDLGWHDRCPNCSSAYSCSVCFRTFKQKLVVKTGACAEGRRHFSRKATILKGNCWCWCQISPLAGDLTFQFQVHFSNRRGVSSCISVEILLVIWRALYLPCLIDVCGHTACCNRVTWVCLCKQWR